EERPDASVVVEDSLAAMGRFVSVISESAPRVVFHRFRWLWDLGFWAFTGPGVSRRVTQRGLVRIGGPGLLRLVDDVRPDVVVSVFPPWPEGAACLRPQR